LGGVLADDPTRLEELRAARELEEFLTLGQRGPGAAAGVN